MVPRLSLLDDVLSPLVRTLVHALHDVFDLLQLQPPQVLVLVQGVRQQLFHTVQTPTEKSDDFCEKTTGVKGRRWDTFPHVDDVDLRVFKVF